MGYDYDWEGEANKQGMAPKLPAGTYNLQILRLIYENRHGQRFQTRDNDFQVLVVYGNGSGQECSEMLTLSEKAGWKLAKLLGACGVNLQEMKENKINPRDFEDPTFAEDFLLPSGVGLKFRGRVDWKTGNDGKAYAEVTPIRREPFADDDIPV